MQNAAVDDVKMAAERNSNVSVAAPAHAALRGGSASLASAAQEVAVVSVAVVKASVGPVGVVAAVVAVLGIPDTGTFLAAPVAGSLRNFRHEEAGPDGRLDLSAALTHPQ